MECTTGVFFLKIKKGQKKKEIKKKKFKKKAISRMLEKS